MGGRSRSAALALVLAVFAVGVVGIPPRVGAQASRPNIVVIISDDQRNDTMRFMPRTKAHIFDEGVTFSNAFVTTPLCCPSRASIFTGMYAHNHGVLANPMPLKKKTLIRHLHDHGYYTGLVGKYLNSWDGSPRPEFDYWVSHAAGASRYFDPFLNVQGDWMQQNGYITHILRDHALDFLRQANLSKRPFILFFTPNAPHADAGRGNPPLAVPAPGDENLYPNLHPHRPPSHNEADISDKPEWLQRTPQLSASEVADLDAFRRSQLQTLNALDQAVMALLQQLQTQGDLNNTMVIYLSDNGYFWGEHRLERKGMVYEEAIRVPFAIRYPPFVAGTRVEHRLVANIDLAPTIYDLAQVPTPGNVDGRSLVPLLRGTSRWRDDLLIEGWGPQARYRALYTLRYVYVETNGNLPELYDLKHDRFQLQNLAGAASVAPVETELRRRLMLYQNRYFIPVAMRSFPR